MFCGNFYKIFQLRKNHNYKPKIIEILTVYHLYLFGI